MTVRWKFAMAICPYFSLLDMACWCHGASGIYPGFQDHLAPCEIETERIEKQLLVGLTYADMSKISMKSSDMDDLSRCRDTNCRTGNAMICADVCSPLKVHSKSVAKRFFPNDSPGVKSWGQEPFRQTSTIPSTIFATRVSSLQ